MSEGSGGEQISPDGKWRWDGHSWVPNSAPAPTAYPQQPAYGQQPPYGQQAPYGYGQPQKESHTLRNVLLILGLVFLLFAGGCTALVVIAANEVDNAITENDDEPGGVDNPLEITEGEAFDVYGFEYQEGWSIVQDDLDNVDIQNLKFENNREEADSAYVKITFLDGQEVVSQVDCNSDTAAVGQIVTLDCYGGDTMPTGYDKITIADAY